MNDARKIGLAALLLCLSGTALAAGSGNVVGSIGARYLDKDAWRPVEDQGQIGVLADIRIGPGPFYVAAGFQASGKEEDVSGGDVTGSVADLSLGLKVMPTIGQVRPYVGAGIASVGAAYEFDPDIGRRDDDSDSSLGVYVGAGVLIRFGHFIVGADLRRIAGTDLELFGADTDADSTVLSALFGWGWGD